LEVKLEAFNLLSFTSLSFKLCSLELVLVFITDFYGSAGFGCVFLGE